MASLPAAPLRSGHLDRARVALVVCVAGLAGLVAVIAYLVSFEAISAYVAAIGAIPTWLKWCGPLLIDTFITIATAFLLWLALSGATLRDEPDAWFAWLLIAAATLASAYLNAAHAPDRWDARLVAGGVPVALLASVHLLVRLMVRLLTLHTSASGATVATTDAPAECRASATATRATTNATSGASGPPARAISPRQSRRSIDATRPVFERLTATGQPVTWRQFAAAFDPPMPRRTAQRHLAAHQATSASAPSANGQRHLTDQEVTL
jgi:hypothetical protein